jgi:hypothetical protein
MVSPRTSRDAPDAITIGFVGNAELSVTKEHGLFSRISWWNGQSEIIYTDIDESLSFGGVLTGASLFKIFQAYDFVAGRLDPGQNM